jgi:hypothetical protein
MIFSFSPVEIQIVVKAFELRTLVRIFYRNANDFDNFDEFMKRGSLISDFIRNEAPQLLRLNPKSFDFDTSARLLRICFASDNFSYAFNAVKLQGVCDWAAVNQVYHHLNLVMSSVQLDSTER